MEFTDQIQVHMKAGDGGDGVVRWRQSAGEAKGGPAGGDGGDGGDIYVQAVRDISILGKYAHKDEFRAEHGEDGGSDKRTGANGEDLVIDLPVGSVIKYGQRKTGFELLEEGDKRKLLSGGEGGLGNTHFKSSTNTSPTEQTDGESGEEDDILIELKLPVDAGFIGRPNAGKSSLVNELTGADSQTGSYEFTTVSPHLGDLYGFVLADIPGLIDGAAEGKGLGHEFLRHVTRVKQLVHCVSLTENEPFKSYEAIRGELASYGEGLEDKPEIIVLTKSDEVSEDKQNEYRQMFQEQTNRSVYITSILDDEAIKEFRDGLVKSLRSQ
jgi:GTP-binding protein